MIIDMSGLGLRCPENAGSQDRQIGKAKQGRWAGKARHCRQAGKAERQACRFAGLQVCGQRGGEGRQAARLARQERRPRRRGSISSVLGHNYGLYSYGRSGSTDSERLASERQHTCEQPVVEAAAAER